MSSLVAADGGPLLAGVDEALRVAAVPGEPGLGEDTVAVPGPRHKGARFCNGNNTNVTDLVFSLRGCVKLAPAMESCNLTFYLQT